MSIRDFLRYCNDKDTIALRMFGGIDCIRLELNMARFHHDLQECIRKYCMNQLRIRRNKYESCTNKRKFVSVLDNS